MKVIAINTSPRTGWNTSQLLNKALEGASDKGAKTQLVNLYALNFKGCSSCFICKKLKGGTPGKCALKDDLSPVLDEVVSSKILLLGIPIYLSSPNGTAQNFIERLIFMNLAYAKERTVFEGVLDIGLIYTMGSSKEGVETLGYDNLISTNIQYFKLLNGQVKHMVSYDSYQFYDYSKYYVPAIDVTLKEKARKGLFPKAKRDAYNLGKKLVIDRILKEELNK